MSVRTTVISKRKLYHDMQSTLTFPKQVIFDEPIELAGERQLLVLLLAVGSSVVLWLSLSLKRLQLEVWAVYRLYYSARPRLTVSQRDLLNHPGP